MIILYRKTGKTNKWRVAYYRYRDRHKSPGTKSALCGTNSKKKIKEGNKNNVPWDPQTWTSGKGKKRFVKTHLKLKRQSY